MSDLFTIYIDRLKGAEVEPISGSLAPDFLDCHEQEVQFSSPVFIEGKAYLAEDHLVICLSAKTKVSLLCSICNQMFHMPLELNGCYLTQPLQECRSSLYDFREALREQILLEVPPYAECLGGCLERRSVNAFIKNCDHSDKEKKHFPFACLDDWKEIGENDGRTKK